MVSMGRPGDAAGPLIYAPEEVARAEKVAVLIPGALARLTMFAPTERWRQQGYALVSFPFPGLDGRPLAPKLKIEAAAARIAGFAAAHPEKRFFFCGYSTGAPIAIRAAEQLGGRSCVAALSPALPYAGGAQSFRRISRDLLAAALRARSVRRRTVWREYYKLLLFGQAVLADAEVAAEARGCLEAHLPRMVYPDREILAAHSDDLRLWSLPPGPRLDAARLRFFIGGADRVFSPAQVARFAARFGAPGITRYDRHGHLIFMTHKAVFDDVLAFFDAAPL